MTGLFDKYIILEKQGDIMEKNLEIEYKMLLTEEVFHQLMNDFTGHTYSQTNYYLTSIELGALRYSLRIREKEGYYEMTLKTPYGT